MKRHGPMPRASVPGWGECSPQRGDLLMTGMTQARQDTRQRLERRRAALAARKGAAAAELSHRNEPLVADFDDAAVQTENDETLAAIAKAADEEIQAIDMALVRLQAGSFGVCEICGTQIAAARLAAVPYAVNCADCAEQK